MTTIYDATNDKRPMVDVLQEVPTGGYIFGGARFYRKTAPGRCKALDVRHFDHEADGRALAEFGARSAAQAEWRQVYKNALKTLPANRTQAYLAQERDADALANKMRLALSGPLADLERQNMAAIAEAELVDLEMTQNAASNRWGY